jgi:hypothetical protein
LKYADQGKGPIAKPSLDFPSFLSFSLSFLSLFLSIFTLTFYIPSTSKSSLVLMESRLTIARVCTKATCSSFLSFLFCFAHHIAPTNSRSVLIGGAVITVLVVCFSMSTSIALAICSLFSLTLLWLFCYYLPTRKREWFSDFVILKCEKISKRQNHQQWNFRLKSWRTHLATWSSWDSTILNGFCFCFCWWKITKRFLVELSC